MVATVLHISSDSNSGPGERSQMLGMAREFLVEHEVDGSDLIRIDVPGRGAGEDGEGSLRTELEPLIPALQSGSLFGGHQGIELVDAQNLRVGEAEILSRLLADADPDAIVVIVSEGSIPAVLSKYVKSNGQSRAVKKLWERDAQKWLTEQIHERGLSLDGAAAVALIQRFGADIASLEQALDQIADSSGKVSAAAVLDRFRNRPNEPIYHYTEAVVRGETSEALRRLGDLLVHQPALVLLGSLETEVRRHSLALIAKDKAELARMAGARSENEGWVDRVWRRRSRLKDSSLRKAVDALVRADRVLKSAPEEIHLVTMERLTVALSRWLAGR